MFPFHTWLPDAHVEAPTAGSVVLASIMLKLGTFGFIRLAVPLFPSAAMSPTIRIDHPRRSRSIGIVYGALVSLVQPDFKKLVAYSSVSHLGFVMLGIFALTVQSVQGALMVMINHGISTGALFFLIGMIYERRHTRLIDDYGGIATRGADVRGACSTIVSFSSIGVPGTNGFVGEFLVLIGSFRTQPMLVVDRDDGGHHLRGVSALGHSAHPVQSARQAGERAHPGSEPPRAGDHDSARRLHHLARRLSRAGARAACRARPSGS